MLLTSADDHTIEYYTDDDFRFRSLLFIDDTVPFSCTKTGLKQLIKSLTKGDLKYRQTIKNSYLKYMYIINFIDNEYHIFICSLYRQPRP